MWIEFAVTLSLEFNHPFFAFVCFHTFCQRIMKNNQWNHWLTDLLFTCCCVWIHICTNEYITSEDFPLHLRQKKRTDGKIKSMTHSVFISTDWKDASPVLREEWLCSIASAFTFVKCNITLLFEGIKSIHAHTHTNAKSWMYDCYLSFNLISL